ncbi:hypothetical protein Taro_027576, partial [Colocasia esculenta]|nr:hypothetical protein [Colocasia esculenta]
GQTFSCKDSVDTTINGVDTMAQSKGRNVKKRSTSVDTSPGQVDTRDKSQRNMLTGFHLRSTLNQIKSPVSPSSSFSKKAQRKGAKEIHKYFMAKRSLNESRKSTIHKAPRLCFTSSIATSPPQLATHRIQPLHSTIACSAHSSRAPALHRFPPTPSHAAHPPACIALDLAQLLNRQRRSFQQTPSVQLSWSPRPWSPQLTSIAYTPPLHTASIAQPPPAHLVRSQ